MLDKVCADSPYFVKFEGNKQQYRGEMTMTMIGNIQAGESSARDERPKTLADSTTLVEALETGTGRTTNGMPTNLSTGSALVDLFGKIGSMRMSTNAEIIKVYSRAFAVEPLLALKTLFWVRDVRGGAGERKVFRVIAKHLAEQHTDAMKQNITLIPEFGRWDDLLVFFGTPLEKKALWLIKDGLSGSVNADGSYNPADNLCKKWMPRKGAHMKKICAFLQITQKEYRALVKSDTVESKMSVGDWEGIQYKFVPSVAFARYAKAFGKHGAKAFRSFMDIPEAVAEIKAGTLFPYDVIRTLEAGGDDVAQAQWNALPNYVKEGERILPVVDTSGSMTWFTVAGKVTGLDVAVGLGLYVAERNLGVFKDHFITFSSNPTLQTVGGTLRERINQLRSQMWQAGTDLDAVFHLILKQARKHNVPESEMPTKIMIISDMEFNNGTSGKTAHGMIDELYASAGYKRPSIVYWNLCGREGNNPVRWDDEGTLFISGFSPAILNTALTGEEDMRTPMEMTLDTLNQERYNSVRFSA